MQKSVSGSKGLKLGKDTTSTSQHDKTLKSSKPKLDDDKNCSAIQQGSEPKAATLEKPSKKRHRNRKNKKNQTQPNNSEIAKVEETNSGEEQICLGKDLECVDNKSVQIVAVNENKVLTQENRLIVEEKVELLKKMPDNTKLKQAGSDTNMKLPSKIDPKLVESEKNPNEIKAAREAKKLAKQTAKKQQNKTDGKDVIIEEKKKLPSSKAKEKEVSTAQVSAVLVNNNKEKDKVEKSREEILVEREAKKLAKQVAKKGKGDTSSGSQSVNDLGTKVNDELSLKLERTLAIDEIGAEKKTKVPAMTKAERRALQESQRQAKQAKQPRPQSSQKDTTNIARVKTSESKKSTQPIMSNTIAKEVLTSLDPPESRPYKVKLFQHLENKSTQRNKFVNDPMLHPAIVKLGEQYLQRTVVGSNARCIAFLNAIKSVIEDFETPPKTEFYRGLEATINQCLSYLRQCRPIAVTVLNAHKCIQNMLTQLPNDQPETNLKERLLNFIDTYIRDQIEKAAEVITTSMGEKISDGDVVLTFGCSSLVNRILEEAHRREADFRVIVVDSRPYLEGQELLRRLISKGIKCTCILINAVGFIMPEATKVLLGAHALLANGYVMARAGTGQVALVAHSFNVPVLVCCETHKFSDSVQTDAIVYNELGDPEALTLRQDSTDSPLKDYKSMKKLSPLNLNYDITPPELVTAVITEIAMLPCTSVPVILRIRPTEIGY